jgi:hypothetical protein
LETFFLDCQLNAPGQIGDVWQIWQSQLLHNSRRLRSRTRTQQSA